MQRAIIDIDSAGTSELVAGVAGKKITVHAIAFTVSGAGTVTFKSDSTSLTGDIALDDKGGFVLSMDGIAYFETAIGEDLDVTLATSTSMQGFLVYDVRD